LRRQQEAENFRVVVELLANTIPLRYLNIAIESQKLVLFPFHYLLDEVQQYFGLRKDQDFVVLFLQLFQELENKVDFGGALAPLIKVLKAKLLLDLLQSLFKHIFYEISVLSNLPRFLLYHHILIAVLVV
jgi:hypothetical protein